MPITTQAELALCKISNEGNINTTSSDPLPVGFLLALEIQTKSELHGGEDKQVLQRTKRTFDKSRFFGAFKVSSFPV